MTATQAITAEQAPDFSAFFCGDELVGWCEPVWDPSVYPCRIAAWLARDERPQADGRPAAYIGTYRSRRVAEATVQAVLAR